MNTTPTLIITGGLGFIFSHVTEHFIKLGWNVVVIDNLSEGSHPEIINKSFDFIEMSVDNPDIIDVIAHINPTYIIHAAAYSDVDKSIAAPLAIIKQNTLGNLYLFEAAKWCLSLRKFLYISTDEIFGECFTKKKEDDILFPKNPYAASKATGALFRYAFDNSYPELKDKTVETRFCNIFGPRQDDRKVIPRIMHALKTGEAMPVHNEGIGKREYLYIKNIPSLIETVLRKGHRTYNITDNALYSVNELITIIEKITNKTVPTKEGVRPGMDSIYQLDSTRVRDELNWTPQYSFDEGLLELLKQEKLC